MKNPFFWIGKGRVGTSSRKAARAYQPIVALLVWAVAGSMLFSSCNKKEKAEAAARADSLAALPATNDRIVGVARVEPEDGLMTLTAGSSGRVLDVLINENDTLAIGQPLVTLEKNQERSQLTQASSKVGSQQAAIAAQQAALESVRLSLQNAEKDYQRNLELYAGKAITKKDLDDSKATLDKLKRDVEQAEAQMREASSRLAEVRADIGYYRTILNDKSVNALVAGRVLKVLVKKGDYVNNDTPIADFAPAGPLYAKTEVDELYAERVKVGQKALLVSQTTGDTLATGEVTYAADYLKQKSLFKDQATELEDRRVREVSVRLNAGQVPLIGSRVDCIIFLK
jgi:HlyD family secretion protein